LFSTRLVFADDSPSPIGRLRMAGTVAASTGIEQRRLESYAIVLAVAGAGRYSDELGVAREIEPGDVLILFPGLRHSYGPGHDQRWDEFYMVFDGPAFEFLEQVGTLDRNNAVISLRPFEAILAELMEIGSAPRPVDPRGRAMEVCWFLRVLMQIVLPGRPAQTWVDRARTRLGGDLDQEFDLSQVAADAGMGYESFRKRFKLATGMSPAEYRSARRIETARELLASTSLSIRQIAANLGYYDEYHFSRRFREAAGSAPGAFRRRVRGS
jgi:AraC-like DNA-binding protein